MEPHLEFPLVELGPGVALGHADESTFFTAWNYRGLLETRSRKVRVIDSCGQEYIFTDAQAVRSGSRLKWWITKALGMPFRVRYMSVEHVGRVPLGRLKKLILEVIQEDRSFYEAAGDVKVLTDRVEQAESYRTAIELLL